MIFDLIAGMNEAATAEWTPADLFQNGEDGFWFDSSDFSTMFQDSGGITPVTAVGNPVGRWENKVAEIAGHDVLALTTATASLRPVVELEVDKPRVAWDGVDDSLTSSAPNFSVGGAITFAIGFRKALPYSNPVHPYWAIGGGAALQNVQVQGDNTVVFQTFGQQIISSNAISNGPMNIGMMWAEQNVTPLNIELNGVTGALTAVPTNGAISASPTLPNTAATVGFGISQLVLINRVLTPKERTQLKTFIGSKQ